LQVVAVAQLDVVVAVAVVLVVLFVKKLMFVEIHPIQQQLVLVGLQEQDPKDQHQVVLKELQDLILYLHPIHHLVVEVVDQVKITLLT
jgi:hypothetical protein